MIKGASIDIYSAEELNQIRSNPRKDYSDAEWEEYYKYVSSDLYSSEYFRRQVIDAGFHLINIYPIYYQGWELDYWGGIAIKDNKKYDLTTDHGSLRSEELIEEPSKWSFWENLFK